MQWWSCKQYNKKWITIVSLRYYLHVRSFWLQPIKFGTTIKLFSYQCSNFYQVSKMANNNYHFALRSLVKRKPSVSNTRPDLIYGYLPACRVDCYFKVSCISGTTTIPTDDEQRGLSLDDVTNYSNETGTVCGLGCEIVQLLSHFLPSVRWTVLHYFRALDSFSTSLIVKVFVQSFLYNNQSL